MIKNCRRLVLFAAITCLIPLWPEQAFSLITVGDRRPVKLWGCPTGAVEMANLPSRMSWMEGPPFGGGQWRFYYQCRTTAEFNHALRVFSRIRVTRLELVIHNGSASEEDEKAADRTDWNFTVWVSEAWDSLHNKREKPFYQPFYLKRETVPAPRIDVTIGGEERLSGNTSKSPTMWS